VHHVPDIFKEMRGMRVLIRIAIGVMHAVHYGIRTWIKKGRALNKKSEKIKKPLPAFAHGKLFVRSIAVIEKGLAEK
jgi:hypothetical protein